MEKKRVNQIVTDTFRSGVPEAWDNFLEDPWYQSGGVVFEVASWLIGAGEIKAGFQAAKGAQGFLAGVKAFASAATKSAAQNIDNVVLKASNLYRYGDDAVKAFMRAMTSSYDDILAHGSRWSREAVEVMSRFKDEMARLMSGMSDNLAYASDNLAYAGFNSADDFTRHTAKVYNVSDDIAKGSYQVSQEFAQEAAEATVQFGDDVAEGLAKTQQQATEVVTDFSDDVAHLDELQKPENLLDSDGVFKDADIEERYQRYLERKGKAGQTPRDRLDWKEASDYWSKESPMARGNRFNKTVKDSDLYEYHEIHLENGKRLDSYDPVAGEIISRKATDLDKIQESTFRDYLSEIREKYSRRTKIRSNQYRELDGLELDGNYILEVPASNADIPNIQHYKDIASEYDVTLRFTEE